MSHASRPIKFDPTRFRPDWTRTRLIDLPVGAVDVTEQTAFYARRWIVEGQEGYVAVLAGALALHRTYKDSFLSAVRVRRTMIGIDADIFTLDVSDLPELPDGVAWLPVVLR